MAAEPLIDRQFLEKLERLTIRWRKSFPGLIGGHNQSRFAGPGQEFLDHRHFHHGDDLRAVNWRAYLRLDKLFLKMFQVEPRVPVRLLLDVSKSMGTGTGQSKFDYARRLTAAMAYIGLVRLDSIIIHPFSDTLGDSHSCSGGRHRFGPAADYLSRLEVAGNSDFFQVSRQFVNKYVNRGLLVIISDFLSDSDIERPMQYLAEFGHELFLVHIWADEDRTPPWDGELDLTDAESGANLQIDFDDEARARYTAAFDEFAQQLQRTAFRHGGRYAGVATSSSLEEAIFGTISRAQGVA
ncbi:MAG: DUF58 domain-containing protein [Bryobacterales bacterium]|nr:DUF58 domain-containing protein [Bryobacterales bacterium]